MQRTLARAAALAALAGVALAGGDEPQQGPFRRIATFPVFLNTDIDTESVAEIVTASEDGNTLVYTDSENESLGFVDLTNPLAPAPAGNLPLPGEPTSVAV
ncbi:MAG: alkaline phosphatase, partial [Planctomycetota bacterium]